MAALCKASGAAALFLLLLGSAASGVVAAQPTSTTSSPTTSTALIVIAAGVAAIIIAVFLLSALFCIVGPRLLGVDEGGGGGRRRAPSGLSREVVEGFPTYLYDDIKVLRRGSKGELECAICLSEFQDDEILRALPKCDHAFHPQCIDPWLLSQATCPICRRVLEAPSDIEQIANEPDASNVHARDHHVLAIDPLPPVRSPVHEGQGYQDPSEPELTTEHIRVLFSEPHSTGHSPVWTIGLEDRFTLRLSKEARMKIAGSKVPRGGSWNERREVRLPAGEESILRLTGEEWVKPAGLVSASLNLIPKTG